MNTVAVARQSRRTIVTLPDMQEEVRQGVWRLLSNLYPVASPMNRRGQQRYPFACLTNIQPVAEDSLTPTGEPIVAATKNISEAGISFFHAANLPYRRVVLTFEYDDLATISFLVDVSWCRFTRHGWYESGGRLLQILKTRQLEGAAMAEPVPAPTLPGDCRAGAFGEPGSP